MWIEDEYYLYIDGEYVGCYCVLEGGVVDWSVGSHIEGEALKGRLKELGLAKSFRRKKHPRLFAELIKDENRVKGTRKVVYEKEDLRLERVARETGEKFWIYRLSAEAGDPGYSPKRYSAPHKEGGKEIEGMEEWASWYCFDKMDDGTFLAELDEAWWWGGGHNDGGTIRTEIPEKWFDLPYDAFLERVITLSAAAHYGFTADELKEKEGLKAFFGFKE